MDPITMLILGFIGMRAMKGKGDKTPPPDTSDSTGTGTTQSAKPDEAGSPVLRIDAVRPLFNTVKFTAMAGGEKVTEKHNRKDMTPTQKRVGNYVVVAATENRIRPGQKEPDVVLIGLKRISDGKTIIGKKILIEDDKIIDLI